MSGEHPLFSLEIDGHAVPVFSAAGQSAEDAATAVFRRACALLEQDSTGHNLRALVGAQWGESGEISPTHDSQPAPSTSESAGV